MARPDDYDDWSYQTSVTDLSSHSVKDIPASGSLAPFTFLCVVTLLVGFGLISMYSASYYEALSHGLAHYYYFFRQAMFVVLALVCSIAIVRIPLEFVRRIGVPVLLGLCLIFMLMTLFTKFGVTRMGARRWLSIGPLPTFQPSELVKAAIVLFLAAWFSKKREKQQGIIHILLPAIIVLLFAALILLQRDYSTTLVFLGVALSLFLIAGLSVGWMTLFLAVIAVPGAIFLLIEPYRIRRLLSFLYPDIDPTGINWQINNSRKAIASGGWFGVGIGEGQYKLGLIPEVHSDFIFASIAEETGILGVGAIFLLFSLFAVLGYRAYQKIKHIEPFLGYAIFGFTTMILWQTLVNIGVVIGALPPTGIPLPFFSQGGTNLFIIICECALIYRALLITSGREQLSNSNGVEYES